MDNVVHGCFIWQCINYLFGDIFESHLIPPYEFHEMKTYSGKSAQNAMHLSIS
jgi:hypothetical protein